MPCIPDGARIPCKKVTVLCYTSTDSYFLCYTSTDSNLVVCSPDMLQGYAHIEGPGSPAAGQLRPQRSSLFGMSHAGSNVVWGGVRS